MNGSSIYVMIAAIAALECYDKNAVEIHPRMK